MLTQWLSEHIEWLCVLFNREEPLINMGPRSSFPVVYTVVVGAYTMVVWGLLWFMATPKLFFWLSLSPPISIAYFCIPYVNDYKNAYSHRVHILKRQSMTSMKGK